MLGQLSKWFFDTSEDEIPMRISPDRPQKTGVSKGRDCVLVVDASGSMESDDWPPTRLDGAKEASKEFCRRLALEDSDARIAIVAYGCDAETYCPLITARELTRLEQAIDEIDSLGSTNMRAGLKQALYLLSHSQRDCQVVFLSDGENTGHSPYPVAAKLREKAVINCVGIGGSPSDVDEGLMKKVASEYPDGSKRYRWIGDRERLVKHFQNLAGRITRS